MKEAANTWLNSTGSKLRSFYRDVRFRVKHPIAEAIKSVTPHLSYSYWIKHSEPNPNAVRIAEAIAKFKYTPKISIVMPVYDTPLDFLDLAIRSVQTQHYENWELCVCDDASPNPNVRARLESWEKQEPRIKITFSTKNEGISGASNRALELASGDFIGLLDHDDELTPHALYEVVNLLQEHPDADMIYSDEDRLDRQGQRVEPFFKPDWSPEYFLSTMYTCHLGVYRRQLIEDIGGFRSRFDGSQDYDLVLRLSERTDRIYHLPKILYHWRMAPGSVAAAPDAKPYAIESATRALTDHLNRRQIPGEIVRGKWPGCHRIRFHLQGTERVSIIIPSLGKAKALRTCAKSIDEKTSYRNYEVIVADKKGAQRCNLSRLINLGAGRAQGSYLIFLYDDVEVISADWITAMLGFCRQREIGVAGAKLLYRTGRIEHMGFVLGLMGLAGRPLRGLRRHPLGYSDPSEFIRNCSAVSGACMMVRKDVFEEVGGFDEQLPAAYNDVDLCLRIREAGYRVVWTPDAQLYSDNVSPRFPLKGEEREYFRRRWDKVLKDDPYYNPNLTLKYEDLGFRV